MPTIDLSEDLARRLDEAVRVYGFESREELISSGLEAIEDLNGGFEPSGETLARIDAGLDALERGDLVRGSEAMKALREDRHAKRTGLVANASRA